MGKNKKKKKATFNLHFLAMFSRQKVEEHSSRNIFVRGAVLAKSYISLR